MSTQGLIQELSRDSLCTYFVLPLLRLSKFSFVTSNFINSYITDEHDCIVVQVYDVSLLSRMVFINTGYISKYEHDGYLYLIYSIPDKWKADVETFCKGKYSQMSDAAKNEIINWSGLDFKRKSKGKITTDGRLLALTKDPVLREAWERELDVILNDDDELLEAPNERTFITLHEKVQL